MADAEKDCYGKMFPPVIKHPDNVTVAGKVLSYRMERPGMFPTECARIGRRKRVATMPHLRRARDVLSPLNQQAIAGDCSVCLTWMNQLEYGNAELIFKGMLQ